MSDKIIVDVIFQPTGTDKNFKQVENKAKQSGAKASVSFSQGFANNISKSFASARSQLTGMVAGFLAFNTIKNTLTSATRSALSFESALVEINTILPKNTKLTEKQTRALRDYSKQFGSTSTSQAKAFYQIISAGITDVTKANLLLESANKLAIGGLTSVGASIDILTSIVNAYGQENQTAQDTADSLFTAVRLGKTTVDELASSLAPVIPGARAAGVSLDVVNSAVAVLTSNGNSTSLAVTRLNALLTALAKNGKTLGKEMDLSAVATDGLNVVLARMEQVTGGSSDKLLKLLGRVEAVQAAQTLMRNGAKQFNSTIEEFTDKTGASNKAFEQMGLTGEQKFKILNAEIEDLKLEMGNGLYPAILRVASGFKTIGAMGADFLGGSKATTVAEDYKQRIDEMTLSIADLVQKNKSAKAELQSGGLGLIREWSLSGDVKNYEKQIYDLGQQLVLLKSQDQAFKEADNLATQKANEISILQNAQGEYELYMAKKRQDAEFDANEALKAQERSNTMFAKIAETRLALQETEEMAKTSQDIFVENTQSNIEGMVSFFGLAGKQMSKISKEIAGNVFSTLSNGIGNAFQNVGKALATNGNAWQAFADGLKAILGDVASAIGDTFIKWGVANLVSGNVGMGSAQIAAGGALKILSGALGASSSGVAGSQGASTANGTQAPITIDDSSINQLQDTRTQAQEQVVVNLNVEGSMVRESELNGYLSEVLEEGASENANIIPSLKTGF